jgi:RNA polymerase sigma factor (sigma-70 family)
MAIMQDDDATLLRSYAESHRQDAFAEVVRRNMDAVYSSALRRLGGDAHLAKDAAQQVFITLASRAGELARHPVLAGWLHTATRNAAANIVRSERRRRLREQEAHAMNEITSKPRLEADWNQIAPVLDEVIDELSAKDSAAVLLRFFDRRTFAEMGVVLRLSEDAARMRVERALEKLRVRLARRGIGSTAAALGAVLAQHTVAAAPAGFAGEVTGGAFKAADAFPGSGSTRLGWLGCVTVAVVFVAALGVVVLRRADLQRVELALQTERRMLASVEERGRADMQVSSSATLRATQIADVSPPERRAGGRRLEVAVAYEGLYRELQLTPAQIAQFETIGARRPGAAIWTYELDPRESAKLPPTAAILGPGAADAELRALLGANGYQRYQDYNRTLPARNLAAQLASAVCLIDPLTAEQGERLIQIMGDASAAYRAGGAIDRATLDWEITLTRASGVLTPTQLAALSGAVRKREAFHQALVERLRGIANAPAATAR